MLHINVISVAVMSVIKCVLVGDPSVGKSSLMSAMWGDFPQQHEVKSTLR